MWSELRERIQLRIDERITRNGESLAAGNATDYAEYRQAVGRIKGLVEAKATIEDAIKEMTDDDDE